MKALLKRKKSKIHLIFTAGLLSLALGSCNFADSKLSIRAENIYESTTPQKNEDGDLFLRVISFNTKNCNDGKNIEEIAKEIENQKADIVFLQELDYKAKRSSRQDLIKLLSDILEMNYAYYPAIPYQGGAYGIGILSRYRLDLAEIFRLESGEEEARVLAKAQVNIVGKNIDIFNTHLSYESTTLRIDQLKYINEKLAESEAFVLAGDFNVGNFEEYGFLKNLVFINRPENQFATFNEAKDGMFACIDNIAFSENFTLKHSWMSDSKISDHNLLVADIII